MRAVAVSGAFEAYYSRPAYPSIDAPAGFEFGALTSNSTHLISLATADRAGVGAKVSTLPLSTLRWSARNTPVSGTPPREGAVFASDGVRRLFAVGGFPPSGITGKSVPIYAFDTRTFP